VERGALTVADDDAPFEAVVFFCILGGKCLKKRTKPSAGIGNLKSYGSR